MGKTKFNEGYADYTEANKLTNHLDHKPGEKVEVDWSGPTMHYVDLNTGEAITVYLFVGTLPYSQYTYVEPCLDMKMDTFLRCHNRMYSFFKGVPRRTVCDNM
jgi:transposase